MYGHHPINNINVQPQCEAQMSINKQTQDNIRILDCTIRTMSTAENLCNVEYKSKEYNIDKKNISSFKSFEQIKDDFLMNIQCLNTMVHLFKKRHEQKKPKILPPYDEKKLKGDLENFRKKVALKNPNLDKYFRDFSNLIDGNNIEFYPENDMLTSFKNEEPLDEEKVNNAAETIINQAEKERKKIERIVENYNENGQANLSPEDDSYGGMDYSDDGVDYDEIYLKK